MAYYSDRERYFFPSNPAPIITQQPGTQMVPAYTWQERGHDRYPDNREIKYPDNRETKYPDNRETKYPGSLERNLDKYPENREKYVEERRYVEAPKRHDDRFDSFDRYNGYDERDRGPDERGKYAYKESSHPVDRYDDRYSQPLPLPPGPVIANSYPAQSHVHSQHKQVHNMGTEGREWTSGLFDCTNDVKVCFCFWCNPFYECMIMEEFGESCWAPWPCVLTPCCALLALRYRARDREQIRGSLVKDCAASVFCGPCACCQLKREMDFLRGKHNRPTQVEYNARY